MHLIHLDTPTDPHVPLPLYANVASRSSLSYRTPRAVVNDFVDDWGEDMLGPLAEHLLSTPPPEGQDGGSERDGDGNDGEEKEGLSDLWPRLSRIHEGMEDLEASRTKVELARQLAVERSNPESISHVVDKVWGFCVLWRDCTPGRVLLAEGRRRKRVTHS